MIKFIAHIADLHFRTYKRHEECMDISKKFFDEIKEFMKKNRLQRDEMRIVIAGDVVHQKITISNELSVLVSWFMEECTKLCPTILIAGNHDLLENNKDRIDTLSPILDKKIYGDKISYFKDSDCFLDDNVVWCVYSIFHENQRPDIEKSRKKYGNDKKYIGLYHAPVNGAYTSIGYEFEDSTDLIQFEGCDAVMMGDIHHRQSFKHNGINIAYSSSLIQQDFGERISKHGYLMWDINTLNFTEHDIDSDYGYYVFKINTLEDIDKEREYVTNS
jgi:DNA repair exonuclease SbcCD nuclease subunit